MAAVPAINGLVWRWPPRGCAKSLVLNMPVAISAIQGPGPAGPGPTAPPKTCQFANGYVIALGPPYAVSAAPPPPT